MARAGSYFRTVARSFVDAPYGSSFVAGFVGLGALIWSVYKWLSGGLEPLQAALVFCFGAFILIGLVYVHGRNAWQAERSARLDLEVALEDKRPIFHIKDSGLRELSVDESVGSLDLLDRLEIALYTEVSSHQRPARNVEGKFIFVKSTLAEVPLIAGEFDGGYSDQRVVTLHRPLPVLTPDMPPCFMALELRFLDPATSEAHRQTFYLKWAGLRPGGVFESAFYSMTRTETDALVSYLDTNMVGGWKR